MSKNDDNDYKYDVVVGGEYLIFMMKLVIMTMVLVVAVVVVMMMSVVMQVMMTVVMLMRMVMMMMRLVMITVLTMMMALVTSVEYQVDNTSEHPASLPATILLSQYCKHNTHHIATIFHNIARTIPNNTHHIASTKMMAKYS